jgi:hypothetical protein
MPGLGGFERVLVARTRCAGTCTGVEPNQLRRRRMPSFTLGAVHRRVQALVRSGSSD